MGTKNNPGNFDCYANADPDEPMFILLGRDRMAAFLVRLWAYWRWLTGEDADKVTEAFECADAMDAWCRAQGKQPDEIALMKLGDFYARNCCRIRPDETN